MQCGTGVMKEAHGTILGEGNEEERRVWVMGRLRVQDVGLSEQWWLYSLLCTSEGIGIERWGERREERFGDGAAAGWYCSVDSGGG